MKLTDARIRTAKAIDKAIRLPDGKGLYLELRPSGARLWRYRYKIGGTENMFALGEYFLDRRPGHVSLEDARKARAEARELVKTGVHPAHRRSAARATQIAAGANDFEGIAREWLAIQADKWTKPQHARAKAWFERDVFPHIGALPIRDVQPAHLLNLLRRVAAGTGKGKRPAPSVALLMRQYCGRVFQFAIATLRADVDPASALRGAIDKPKTKHRAALKRERIPALLAKIDPYSGDVATGIALHLLLLTFVRQGELRGALWSEFDLERAVWTVPAERMKMRTPHIVPLSRQAVALLTRLKAITGGRAHLFPNHRNPKACMGKTTLNAALVRMGFGNELTPHGFRATASTMLNELGHPSDVIERQLAHEQRNRVRASYNHAEYMPERRKMMQQWADILANLAKGAQVVPMKRRA